MVTPETRRRQPRSHAQMGTPPGSIEVDPQAPRPILTAIAYDGESLSEHVLAQPDALLALRSAKTLWVNVDGLGDAAVLQRIGEIFGLHPLSLEDVVNVRQRPKVETFATYQFIVLRMVVLGQSPPSDQMSLFLGQNYVLTFQEYPGDCFEPVRERLRKNNRKLRESGADFLAYSLIDALIDHYFPILEHCGERLESLQDEVLQQPSQAAVAAINQLKRDLLALRRAIWPLRDELNALLRQSDWIRTDTAVYLRDCTDHTLMLIDMIETQREIAGTLMDVYLSSVSFRMNEVMKVLTIIATIFIPLTFIAGIYGMNFNPAASPWNMPELNAYWGYPLCLGSMALTGAAFLTLVWRKGWFKSDIAQTRPTKNDE